MFIYDAFKVKYSKPECGWEPVWQVNRVWSSISLALAPERARSFIFCESHKSPQRAQ